MLRVALVLLLFVGIGLIAWRWTNESAVEEIPRAKINGRSVDSKSTDTGRFFVGAEKCADCHSEYFDAWQRSGHSHTIASATGVKFRDRLHGMTFHDVERDVEFKYEASAEGVSALLPEKFGDKAFPLQFALGSGTHAVTFMSLLANAAGETFGIEHRMTWFAHADGPALTPQPLLGHPEVDAEFFGRKFEGSELLKCFACHTTTCDIQDAKLVNVIPQVGCESCHGAGSQHVAAMNEDDPPTDLGLDFPNAIRTAEAEMRVCEQCHRTARDVPDGKLFADNVELVRLQPVGLSQSACYLQSEGRLRCSTCHDPHDHVGSKPRTEQLATCVSCHNPDHGQTHCIQPLDADCISCHMPPVEIHPGVSFHDHWIRVRKSDSAE